MSETKSPDPKKTDPVNTAGPSARPGGPAGPVTGSTVTSGPIIDLKATRVPEQAASKDAPKPAATVPNKPGETKPADTKPADMKSGGPIPAAKPGDSKLGDSKPGETKSGPSPAPVTASKAPSSPAPAASSAGAVPPAAKARGGFGSMAAAGLIGGVIGAGLLFAADKAGIGGDAGRLSALDQKLSGQISALDQRVGGLAPKDALASLDKRVAAAEASAKQALDKASAQPSAQGQTDGQPGGEAAAVPPDLAARLDSLDQRVSALQEEPGRDQGGNAAWASRKPMERSKSPSLMPG